MIEKLIVVDKNDNIIGFEEKEKCHDARGILHRAFSIFIFNNQKQLLIQQRSKLKMLWPLYWSNACCSHPRLNENLVESSKRRLKEECGISCDLKKLYKFQYSARYKDKGSENEICSVFIGRLANEQDILINPKEIANFKWINMDELKKDIKENSNKYTPWFKIEIEELFSNYKDKINELFNY